MNPEFCESSLGGDDEGNLLQPSVVEDLRSRQQRWHGIHRSRRDTQRRRKSKTTRNEREHKKLWRLSGLSSFTREELNHIRATTQQISFPNFLASPVELLDILVKGALTFAHAVKRRRRGKHAGAVCLCGLCTPLPGCVDRFWTLRRIWLASERIATQNCPAKQKAETKRSSGAVKP
ncbi:uncharacterized protein [Trachinotus anak]|uniref:uncharacterized protein isoform X3 n=1 Tax=Trachinotus anak TaxID=443729 RepID=UPI0039F1D587